MGEEAGEEVVVVAEAGEVGDVMKAEAGEERDVMVVEAGEEGRGGGN